MAGDAVEFITLWEEAPRSNHLLALAASEAVLVPDHLLVFNILVSYNRKKTLQVGFQACDKHAVTSCSVMAARSVHTGLQQLFTTYFYIQF